MSLREKLAARGFKFDDWGGFRFVETTCGKCGNVAVHAVPYDSRLPSSEPVGSCLVCRATLPDR